MPTGYTAPVQDGEITEFADFALSVARGFGPLVLLRDHDSSLESTKRFIEEGAYLETDTHEQKLIAEYVTRLAQLRAMTDEEALAAAQAQADARKASNEESKAKAALTRERYEAMITKVEAWQPPTEDHVEFKEFMLKQLRDSIPHDCGYWEMDVPPASLAWRDRQIEELQRSIESIEKRIEEQRERNIARRAWVEALLESLGERVHA